MNPEQPLDRREALDRHALVMTIWFGLGLAAAILFHYGFGKGGMAHVVAGFAVLLAAFVGHVLVNAVYRTRFTTPELALGLVLYAAALLGFAAAALLSPEFRARNFLPVGLGLLLFGAAVLFYLLTHYGVRQVFEAFDVVRDFKPPARRDTRRPGR